MYKIDKIIVMFVLLTVLSGVFSLPANAEQRVALVIGNSSYETSPLANPVNDASDMAAALRKLGFTVILKTNANLEMMEEAIEDFSVQLRKGGVGLFYYAGHGIQVYGANYLIPVGARIKKESDVKYRAVNAGRILDEMAYAANNMNIVILDACRDNPFSRSFRSSSRGLSIISAAPRGTFVTYSTSPGNVAADGKGRNSPYTESLLKHMNTPGLPIEQVFKQVRHDLSNKTNGQQIPWELSSLSGDFYFNPGSAGQKSEPAIFNTPAADTSLEEERRKLEEERERLRKEAALLEERNALEETKRRIEEERKKLEAEKQRLASLPKVDPARGTRAIDFLSAKVTEVKFFEGGYDPPAKEQRSYRTSFSRTATRYVNWELNLTHPAPGLKKDFGIEHIWYNSYGTEIFRSSFNSYIQSDWTYSYHNSGYGWREAASNTWVAGTYRVDLYVHGIKVASETFNIY